MKRVFLSFADEDAPKVKHLLSLLASPEYELDYYSAPLGIDVDSEQGRQINRAIGEKIVKCNITVCLIGENTHRSKWVDAQLQKNRNKGNRIIAMALKGTVEAVLPAVVREENIPFSPWDPQRLKELIADDVVKLFEK
jgi:MTH538 TIR-like domain (DUF1863)